jgi:hypothetical protein
LLATRRKARPHRIVERGAIVARTLEPRNDPRESSGRGDAE